ncbi:thiamine diphosphokinase [Ruegeria arenilitoris]|uniref:thiamine diphosphokinase n=1 Tax=Ruegeria arenilitoris TaxID=1173585 RepID=UPI00147FD1BC|nr:thiamine diphosphokinase [Ruegeria arenilitoris]
MVNLAKIKPIVRAEEPIALFGGGKIGPQDLSLALSRVDRLVAADGGAAILIDSGHMPEAVIGDLDSLEPRHRDRIPPDRLFPITEQDSTDFDKSLRHIQAPLVLGLGFLGERVDHKLATFNSLIRRQDRPCVLLGSKEIVFHAPPQIELPIEPEQTVSLFPLRRVTGSSKGLEWPIDELVMEPDGLVGTSNKAVANVELRIDGPGLLVILPRSALDIVMQAFLSGQTGRWPAPVE